MSEIVLVPNPVLKQSAKKVEKIDKKLLSIIADMITTLEAAKNPEGVGLAAPQIDISLRIFVSKPTRRSKPKIFLNPEITHLSKESQGPDDNDGVYEGCLSIPHHYAPISRALSLTVKYQTIEPKVKTKDPLAKFDTNPENWVMKEKTEDYSGFAAHIIQHEVDHLNGILFTDHVLSQNTPLFRIKGKTWEEVGL